MTADNLPDNYGGGSHLVEDMTETIPLRELEFTDLFFSENGEAFVRGLEDAEGPLAAVPVEAICDLDEIHRRVCDRGQREDEFFLEFDGMRFRVSKIDDVRGTWYTLRRLKWPLPNLQELGLPLRVVQQLGLLGRPGKHGLIIVAGATSNGKTTTACSLLLSYLRQYGNVALTIEDPIEYPLSGAHGNFGHCFQTAVQNGDFATAMKKSMRRAPRYILLGEVRSAHEATHAIKAATNGHLVITTIHAGNVVEAIQAMLKFVAAEGEDLELSRSILADGIAGVLHQELIKRKDRPGWFIKPEFLFPGDDKAIRTRIRTGKLEQLSSDIEVQRGRVMRNQMPTGE